MKNIQLTKKDKIISTIIVITLILGISILITFNNMNKAKNNIKGIYLDVELLSEGDKIDYSQDALILHVDSKAQLSYDTVPKSKKIDIKFNDYDKDIISVDSLGNITALKTGITEIQIFSDDISSNIMKIYVY